MSEQKLILCEKCNVNVLNCSEHLRTKIHLKNDPDPPRETIKPGKVGRPKIYDNPTKLCKICIVEVTVFSKHLKSIRHLENDPDPPRDPQETIKKSTNKREKCNVTLLSENLLNHLKNDPDPPRETIKPIKKLSDKPTKPCKICDVEVSSMSRHLKTQMHLKNNCKAEN
jgi:hypothetical protein